MKYMHSLFLTEADELTVYDKSAFVSNGDTDPKALPFKTETH